MGERSARASPPGDDETTLAERGEGLAECDGRHPEPARQLRLGRKLLAVENEA